MQPHILPDDVPVDPIDEQLVAYLDGELDPAERDTLEQRLVDDPTLRERLQQLQGGWEMLDELPTSSVREQFTETTLEMVAADASRDMKVKQSRLWRRQWTLPVMAALLAMLAVAGGAAAVVAARQSEMRRQLRDLPLAQHLDAYRYAHDLPLMRALAQHPQWQEHVEAAVKLRQMQFPTTDLQAIPVSQRQETIANLELRDRETLAHNWREFNLMSDEQRQKIRDVAQQVQSDPERQQLLQTMDAYARWYQTLDKTTQTAIRESQGKQRDEVMRQAMERSRREWISRSGPLLEADDVEAIYDVLQTAARSWTEMIRNDDDAIPSMHQRWLKRRVHYYVHYDQPSPEAAVLNYIFVRHRPWLNSAVSGGSPGAFGHDSLHSVFRLTDWDYETIPSILSDQAQEQLEAMVTQDLQRDLLDQWMYEAVLRTTGNGRETLPRVERLMAMDPEQREELELAPPATIFGRLDRRSRGSGPPSPGRGSFRGYPPGAPTSPPDAPAPGPPRSPAPAPGTPDPCPAD